MPIGDHGDRGDAIFDPAAINRLIGSSSGWLGVLAASAIGSITLIPRFNAIPTAAMLRKGGADLRRARRDGRRWAPR